LKLQRKNLLTTRQVVQLVTDAYLTIDDAPSSHMVEKVNTLDDLDIQATFFCEGAKIYERRDQVINAIESGHIIGNHSWNHIRFSDLSLSECQSEIKKTDEIIDSVYEESTQERIYTWFRFPFGDRGNTKEKGSEDKKQNIQSILKEYNYNSPTFNSFKDQKFEPFLNYRDWYWTTNIQEYKCNSFSEFKQKMQDSDEIKDLIKSNNPEIVLFHDHENTHEWFEYFIKNLRKNGISFLDFNFNR
jgi:peptidoglycan/xylan/chitin deacetylase (PgdA/CDA1 family)